MPRGPWRSMVLLVGLALILTACGGAKPTEQPQSSATSPAAPAGPVRLVVGAPADIQHWDIHNHNYTYTEAVHQHVFDYLVYMNPDTGKFEPGLAKAWKLVNPTTWEFELREGVKFQNGDPLTAEDVKWTVERVARDKTLAENSAMRTVKEVKIVSPLVVQIITNAPDPVLLNRLSRIGSGILPAKFFAGKDVKAAMEEFQKAPYGTGAYKVKEWKKDSSLTLTAWDGHWRGKPKVDEIVFRVIPETQTRVSELKTGGIDIALAIGADDLKALKGDAGVQVFTVETPRVYLAMIRTSGNYVVADPKVRAAIDYAIDNKALGEALMPGLTVPTRTRLIPGVFGTNLDLYNKSIYDPARAKKLLEEAGFTGGKKPQLTILSRNSAPFPDMAQTMQGMLEQVGFQVKLDLVDTTTYNKRTDANNPTWPDMYITSLGNSLKDADLAVNFAHSNRAAKTHGYSNPKIDALITAAAQELVPEKRAALYKQISEIIAEDRPQISFFQAKAAHAVRKGVNWTPRVDEMLWLHDVTKGK